MRRLPVALGALALVTTLVIVAWTSPLVDRWRRGLAVLAPSSAVRVSRPVPARAPAAMPATRPPGAPPVLPASDLAHWLELRPVGYRDPFFTPQEERARPRPVGGVARPAPVRTDWPWPPVSSVPLVVISGPSRVAMVDDRLVTVGEMLGDERVVDIRADGIVLEARGHRRLVPLASSGVALVEAGPSGRGSERP